MRLRSIGALLASAALCLSVPGAALESRDHLSSNTIAQIKRKQHAILVRLHDAQQDDDYSEFFLDNVPIPFAEDQFFEIGPDWADMWPDPDEDDVYDLSSTARLKEIPPLTSILERYKLT